MADSPYTEGFPMFGWQISAGHADDQFVPLSDAERLREALEQIRAQAHVLTPDELLMITNAALGLSEGIDRRTGSHSRPVRSGPLAESDPERGDPESEYGFWAPGMPGRTKPNPERGE